MSWFLVDDNITENGKMLDLLSTPIGFEAAGFWMLCGAWSRRAKSAGFVPRTTADAIARKSMHHQDSARLATALVDVGLWDKIRDGYHFHDWDIVYSKEIKDAERRRKETERKRRQRSGTEAGQGTDRQRDKERDCPQPVRGTPGDGDGRGEVVLDDQVVLGPRLSRMGFAAPGPSDADLDALEREAVQGEATGLRVVRP